MRRATGDVLARLVDQDLGRYATHSESGHYTVASWLDIYTRHPREHASQLVETRNA